MSQKIAASWIYDGSISEKAGIDLDALLGSLQRPHAKLEKVTSCPNES